MSISKFLDPKNDLAFRRIFGSEKNKDILIHFINDVLGLEGSNQIQDVTFQPTIQEPEIAVKKQSAVDVLCKDANGVFIIVEMQVAPQEGFEKRAQYYAAKAYSRQLNKGKLEGSRYKDLKEVVFIAICDKTIFKDKEAYLSRHILLDQETYTQDLQDFSFTFIELSKFRIKKIVQLSNIIEKWCYFFKYAESTKEADLAEIVGKDKVIERAYEELNQFNWTEIELMAYEKEVKRIMDNQAAEDYLVNQAKAEGEAKGKAEGKAEGIAEGIAKGIVEGVEKGRIEEKREIARELLANKVDIRVIAISTGLSIREIEQLGTKG
jgi:predicted transposase/invertase (TIGR01784 family)